jgi:hypothetical protein
MPTTSATLFPGQQALWSADRAYRSFLRRPVDDKAELAAKPPIAFILLNPSTADEVQDDRTVARARRFAAAWGYGEVIILNAFAFRATNPQLLRVQADPVGAENDAVIVQSVEAVLAAQGTVVCGWGNHAKLYNRSAALRALLAKRTLQAFPLTQQGEPRHPLYLPHDVKRQPFLV